MRGLGKNGHSAKRLPRQPLKIRRKIRGKELKSTVKAKRPPKVQSEHDKVILEVAKREINLDEYTVGINPSESKKYPVRLAGREWIYPDLVVKYRTSRQLQEVHEVETSESVNQEEVNQWKDFASLRHRFILWVPLDSAARAAALIEKNVLKNVDLEVYEVDRHGKIKLRVLGPT